MSLQSSPYVDVVVVDVAVDVVDVVVDDVVVACVKGSIGRAQKTHWNRNGTIV